VSARIEAAFEANRRGMRPVNTVLLAEIVAAFLPPVFEDPSPVPAFASAGLRSWVDTNVTEHRLPHYAIVTVSLKPIGGTPGDATGDQMRVLADLAEELGHDELRVSHEQNIILPHVPRRHLATVYARLKAAGLATANVGLVSDIIACPGMDYCALATARSIPVAQGISEAFADLGRQRDIGPLKIKISGCNNACGHHHVGHIGILGLDRAGVENYQITLGGDGTETAAIGEKAGPGFAYDEVVPAVERLVEAYLDLRQEPGETFLEAYRRVGIEPFRAALYPAEERSDAA
jgi:sulfite reductase (NADPH) hemoprotein beta-component